MDMTHHTIAACRATLSVLADADSGGPQKGRPGPKPRRLKFALPWKDLAKRMVRTDVPEPNDDDASEGETEEPEDPENATT